MHPKGGRRKPPTRQGPRARQRIELAKLRLHYEGAATQLRTKQDDGLVDRYAYEMARGDKFPPIEAVTVGDGTYYVGDGWHRVAAAKLNAKRDSRRKRTIDAIVHAAPRGMKPIDYAVRLALRANTTHGLMLTKGDQLKRAKVALRLPEFRGLTDSALEREIGASRMTVARARAELLAAGELPEWHTGEPLPPFVPLEYARLHRKGTQGHPLCWDRELRDEVFAFVRQLKAFAPKEWRYRFDGEDASSTDDAEGDEGHEGSDWPDHWGGYVEHAGLLAGQVVLFNPFPPNKVSTDGLPKLRRIADPHAVLSDDMRRRIERAKRERQVRAAWGRITGHVDKAVPEAVRLIVERAERDAGFLDDLWTVLPTRPAEF
jgi:hypothetical protein